MTFRTRFAAFASTFALVFIAFLQPAHAQLANVTVTMTDGVTTATPGGSVTYTITASNAGPGVANSVLVDVQLGALRTCAWTCAGNGASCTAAGTGSIADALPALFPGASVTYTASCTIASGATGDPGTVSDVSWSNPDGTPGFTFAGDYDVLVPQADLAITATDGSTSATPGGATTYTIVASNAGPSDDSAANVVDSFPAPLACTWACAGTSGGTCSASGSGNINDTPNLPAGAFVTYTAACSIGAAATGTLSNTATVTSSVIDPTPANNSATDTDALAASADIAVALSASAGQVTPGSPVDLSVVVTNNGPSDASATVSDGFPGALACTWTCSATSGGTCGAAGSAAIADALTLPVGASATYVAHCTVSGAALGSIVDAVTVSSPTADPFPGNNSASVTVTAAMAVPVPLLSERALVLLAMLVLAAGAWATIARRKR